MYSSAYIWGRIISALEDKLTSTVVGTFLDDADIVEVTDSRIILSTPSEYRKDMIMKSFSGYIQEAMKKLFDKTVEVVVLTTEEAEQHSSERKPEEPFMFQEQFTFDRFVVGDSNRLAHAAAVAVASQPAGNYNPLLIYGPSGLGKTHLLYAIARELHLQHPDFKIVYIKGEQFVNELIEAIQAGKNEQFRNKYRTADLLLMDDIHFLAGKERTQEEFFHTFNALYEANKQIVLTCDRPPQDIPQLTDRLRTRFQWGLTTDIQPPDYETRMAIIKNKAFTLGVDFPEDVEVYLGENITANVRQLEGAVKRIIATHELTGERINLPMAMRAIKIMLRDKAEPTIPIIISEVCNAYSVEEKNLRGSKQDKVTVEARQVAMYLIREMLGISFPDIGREFGKDHTTVLYSYNKTKKLLADSTSGISNNIREITANIHNRL